MNRENRRAVILIAVGTFIVLVLTILYTISLTYRPAYSASIGPQKYVALRTLPNGTHTATLHLNIVQEVGVGPHPDWLGYQVHGAQVPGTIFHLPTNTLVTVIVDNFDSRTAPRNNFFTLVQGTVGGVEYVNGKKLTVMNPDLVSHTFTIPDLGVSVPMEGIPDSGNPDHETMKFSFWIRKAGNYRWQCIIPCGSGLYGFGGPMQEFGYMDGWLNVS